VQQVVHCQIHRITSLARDDAEAERITETRPTSFPGDILFCALYAVKGIVDAAVPGAAAKVALQVKWKVLFLLFREAGGRHDHARAAKAALEPLRIKKRLLYRMQIAIAREALNGRNLAICCTESRKQAAMHRFPVEPDRAGAAIAGIAAFLDSEPTKAADKSSQTLARPGFGIEEFPVDFVPHKKMLQLESCCRICSAK
jgi:hypothetical protein